MIATGFVISLTMSTGVICTGVFTGATIVVMFWMISSVLVSFCHDAR